MVARANHRTNLALQWSCFGFGQVSTGARSPGETTSIKALLASSAPGSAAHATPPSPLQIFGFLSLLWLPVSR